MQSIDKIVLGSWGDRTDDGHGRTALYRSGELLAPQMLKAIARSEDVPQFTLAADTHKGTRAGFSTAEPPETAKVLFGTLVELACRRHADVATGEFGAHMQVGLINNGPVTFWLEAS